MRLSRWLAFTFVAGLFGINAPAHALVFNYQAVLDGPSEFPANASPGTGFATVDYDDVAHTMRIQASFSGLLGTTSAAHIHAPTAVPFAGAIGVATQTPSFSGFPLGVTAGAMDTTFNMLLATTWNGSYVTANGGTPAGAEAAFASHLAQGRAYFNIHSSAFPGGEIRGFLTLIPEPATIGLAAAAAFALIYTNRRARKA